MSIIDLGDLTLDAPAPPGPRQRSVSPQWLRVVQATVGGVLALLVLAGSMVAARPTLPLVAALPIRPQSRIMVDGTRLYAVARVAGRSEITAYSLRSGDRLWTTKIGLPGGAAVLTWATAQATVASVARAASVRRARL